MLLIIRHPARLLECIEFKPEDVASTLDPEADRQERIRFLQLTANHEHMPQYILSRLTANFGVADPNEDDLKNKIMSAQPLFQIEPGHRPSKKDYEFVRPISQGAYGAVYLAKHKKSEQLVAIKMLKKKDILAKNLMNQVLHERDIMQFAQNPFLVNMICSFSTKESLYIVMEYAPGGDLASLIKNVGALDEKSARRYIAETILAVEYLHDYGIIHRDLKPDNLVIGTQGHIKLTDFGLSKIGLMNRTTMIEMHAQTFKDSQVLGTPDYIAPEVILGQGYGQAVDWWSIGIILYELVLSVPPFRGDSVQDIFSKAVKEQVEWPSEEYAVLSREFKDLVAQLLIKDPALRLGTPPSSVLEDAMPGAFYVKEHDFFSLPIENENGIDWDILLQEKACFVPELESADDTSYFDDRKGRYSHQMSSSDSDESDNQSKMSAASSVPFGDFDRVSASAPRDRSMVKIQQLAIASPISKSGSWRNSSSSTLLDEGPRESIDMAASFNADVFPAPELQPAKISLLATPKDRKRTVSDPMKKALLGNPSQSSRQASDPAITIPANFSSPDGQFTAHLDYSKQEQLDSEHSTPQSTVESESFSHRSSIKSRLRKVASTLHEDSHSDDFSVESISLVPLHIDPAVQQTTPVRSFSTDPPQAIGVSPSRLQHQLSLPENGQGPDQATRALSPISPKSGDQKFLSPTRKTLLAVDNELADLDPSTMIQRRVERRNSTRSRLSKRNDCIYGCERCSTVTIDWDSTTGGYGFALQCEPVSNAINIESQITDLAG